MSMPKLARNLDTDQGKDRFQHFLIEETEIEIENKSFIDSRRLSPKGKEKFPSLLRHAAMTNDTQWLIQALNQPHYLRTREGIKENGGDGKVLRFVRMPKNAVQNLAHSQMNRLKLRAHCRLLLEQGQKEIELPSRKCGAPWEMELRKFDLKELLTDLRRNACQETLLF